jgi:hypothetical protein
MEFMKREEDIAKVIEGYQAKERESKLAISFF